MDASFIVDLTHKLDHFQHQLDRIEREVKGIMATQQELVVGLNEVKATLVKIGTETTSLLKKIDDLQAVITNNPVSPEVQAAFDAVKAQAGIVDDLVPDLPPVTPPG